MSFEEYCFPSRHPGKANPTATRSRVYRLPAACLSPYGAPHRLPKDMPAEGLSFKTLMLGEAAVGEGWVGLGGGGTPALPGGTVSSWLVCLWLR